FALAVIALLAVYLVGGRRAVTSTVASTKKQVFNLQRRGAEILSRSDGNAGVTDFSGQDSARGVAAKSGFASGYRVDRWWRVGSEKVASTTRGGGGGGSSSVSG
ncbi:unnamed protein product, partial [Laminaria digitata]